MSEPNEPIQEAVLIERGLYEQVVEGLKEIAGEVVGDAELLCHPTPAALTAQRLLTQLTEKQS
jgi:hypothetical protein